MGFPIDLPSGKGMTINYMLCIICFGLFFFWRKCSTVVVVGVQTSFLPFAKSVTEKTTAGWIARRQAKRLCKPCASTGSAAVRLNEMARKGEDFCLPGI